MSSKPLKVVAFNGSCHKNGHTTKAIDIVFAELRKEGIECEMVMLGTGNPTTGCRGCNACLKRGNCVRTKPYDPLDTWLAKTVEADGLILASPTYFANVSTEMKAYIDRVGWQCIFRKLLVNKVGAAVVSCMGSGSTNCFDAINRFFGINQCHIVGSCAWNSLIGPTGSEPYPSQHDIKSLSTLGQNMAFVLRKLYRRPLHSPSLPLPPLPDIENAVTASSAIDGDEKPEEKKEEEKKEEEKKEEEKKEEVSSTPSSSEPKKLKVVAFNGSFKGRGNCYHLIEMVFAELRKEGIECEIVQVGSAPCVHGCVGCMACHKVGHCVHCDHGDPINTWWEKAQEADGLLIASPTHVANVPTELMSFMHRVGMMAIAKDSFKHKVAAPIVAYRRGGALGVYESISKWITYLNMHMITSSYWNEGLGLNPGDVENDEEGKEVMKNIGQSMAMMLKRLHQPDITEEH